MTGIRRHPCGPRLYLAGRRVHHGATGAGLAIVAAACRRRWLAGLGLALVLHDVRDFPWRDCDNHHSSRR